MWIYSKKGNYQCHVCFKNVDEKYRKSQRELRCVFVDLRRKSLRQSSERRDVVLYEYVRLVQDMCEGSETVVRRAIGITDSFKVKVGLHQVSALIPFLFGVSMDRLTDEVRREPPWTMLVANIIVIGKQTRKEVKRKLECWRYALERREMKISWSKTKYLFVNKGNDKETVKMDDTKVPRVKEFNIWD